MAASGEIQEKLRRLQLLTTTLTACGVIAVFGFAGFSIYEVLTLRSQQAQLTDLTEDLCTTLERAGILIQGSRENPCER